MVPAWRRDREAVRGAVGLRQAHGSLGRGVWATCRVRGCPLQLGVQADHFQQLRGGVLGQVQEDLVERARPRIETRALACVEQGGQGSGGGMRTGILACLRCQSRPQAQTGGQGWGMHCAPFAGLMLSMALLLLMMLSAAFMNSALLPSTANGEGAGLQMGACKWLHSPIGAPTEVPRLLMMRKEFARWCMQAPARWQWREAHPACTPPQWR